MPLQYLDGLLLPAEPLGVGPAQIVDSLTEEGLFLEQIFQKEDALLVLASHLVDLGQDEGDYMIVLSGFLLHVVLEQSDCEFVLLGAHVVLEEGEDDGEGELVPAVDFLLAAAGDVLVEERSGVLGEEELLYILGTGRVDIFISNY